MGNIWEFLLQTATVSAAAALILLLKAVFADKLSPRWQYGIWSLLALRLLLPVNTGRSLLPSLPLWMELFKAAVEGRISSAYSAVYEPSAPEHVLPLLRGLPRSVTDWLMTVYALGVLLFLGRYLVRYTRLRRLLRKGRAASPAMEEKIAAVCERHSLRACRAIELEGVRSAFVCGVLRPVLVLPAGEDTDEKILLHELLHLRCFDALQNIFWCVMRSLHWCNIFLHYVFDRIGNDMEALCDQRVLERLEGEERRDYGGILLAMANEKYARAPGTSSISNGGRNISRRIEAIVRFKKYPKGMALVSLCILIVLAGPILIGTEASFDGDDYRPASAMQLDRAMAMARINRCGTMAGALDTYAKGLIRGNGVYLAVASPLSAQESLYRAMKEQEGSGAELYHVDSGVELAHAGSYLVYNIRDNGDGSFSALLAVRVNGYDSEAMGEEYNTEGMSGYGTSLYVLVPVRVWQADGGWVVAQEGERTAMTPEAVRPGGGESRIPALRTLRAEGETGTVTVEIRVCCGMNNESYTGGGFIPFGTVFDDTPRPDGEFDFVTATAEVIYDCPAYARGEGPRDYVGISCVLPEWDTGEYDTISIYDCGREYGSGGYERYQLRLNDGWNGELTVSCPIDGYKIGGGLPSAYKVRIFWEAKLIETLTISEVVE